MTLPTRAYASKEAALTAFREEYNNVKDEHAVRCVDLDGWLHIDDAFECGSCGRYFFDDLELLDEGLCGDCWGEA